MATLRVTTGVPSLGKSQPASFTGEFLTLLGPSGCGKSTTLAALAGLDRPIAGTIPIGDRVLFDGAVGVFVDASLRTGVTAVYVTHDQTEAMALSDRIIVMNKGRIAQIGLRRKASGSNRARSCCRLDPRNVAAGRLELHVRGIAPRLPIDAGIPEAPSPPEPGGQRSAARPKGRGAV